jgi:hypothetical protein
LGYPLLAEENTGGLSEVGVETVDFVPVVRL